MSIVYNPPSTTFCSHHTYSEANGSSVESVLIKLDLSTDWKGPVPYTGSGASVMPSGSPTSKALMLKARQA